MGVNVFLIDFSDYDFWGEVFFVNLILGFECGPEAGLD